ncbi:MAG: transposase [Candidatus Omnitrophota bacterium]|nr:transposase [Candidatus Omnitrophota bacterium]
MPRLARIIAPGLPHHITQRGNYRQDVFDDDSDRRRYLIWMDEYSRKYNLLIIAYCLMSNHVHFIVIPSDEYSIARTFNTAHMRYSQYRNKKMGTAGHLWQGRFFSCVMDEKHLAAAARYIERNPVRAHIAKKAYDYVWSSAKDHVDNTHTSIIDSGELFKYVDIEQVKWKSFIDAPDNTEDISSIRKYTMTGRPLGRESFINKLEKEFGERLHALPVGRPKIVEKK